MSDGGAGKKNGAASKEQPLVLSRSKIVAYDAFAKCKKCGALRYIERKSRLCFHCHTKVG